MAIEMSTDSAICFRCGRKFGRMRGNFPACNAMLYRGRGYLHICKECVEEMFNAYLGQSHDAKKSVRQMCRKLDIYWSEEVWHLAEHSTKGKSLMAQYLFKANTQKYIGKCYDDTLKEENCFWEFRVCSGSPEDNEEGGSDSDMPVPNKVKAAWGAGFSNSTYRELEQRYQYWLSKLPPGTDLSIGSTDALIRQICALEIDINRDRLAGKDVNKSTNTLNTLLGSADLKPNQRKDGVDAQLEKTPYGVWIKKFEDEEPIPREDPDMKDSHGIIRYILTWLYGHNAKMFNVKNAHRRLYDKAIERLRVEHPEYDGDDEDTLLDEVFGDTGDVDDETY